MVSLRRRAENAGIQPSYEDVWGKTHQVTDEVLEALLTALGEAEPTPFPLNVVVTAGQPRRLDIPGHVSWSLQEEPGQTLAQGMATHFIDLPALPVGYYTLLLSDAEKAGAPRSMCMILAAPPRCWLPEELRQGKRIWGIAAQLYSLRSEENWGIGDFSDLAALAKKAGRLGADVLGINPLHLLFPERPEQASPYSPSSRKRLNPLYIDLRRVEGFTPALLSEDEQTALDQARQRELVDYKAVAALKMAVLKRLHEQLMPAAAFEDWLQSLAEAQLAEAQRAAKDAGMMLGLYRDLAVGDDPHGLDMAEQREAYAPKVSIGAPPDAYNPKGQNWGLPPFNPRMLRERHFAPFIQLIRANMAHAGALRIDHAFGLARLYLVPQGMQEGAYVAMPFDELLAVLRIESHRNQCVVIGEDLGTFPPGYKEKAAASGVFSYRVLYFERNENGFLPPARYPREALVTLSTHDLPTLAGWLEGADLEERAALDLFPTPELLQKEREARPKDVALLKQALEQAGLPTSAEEMAISVQRFLAQSPAAISMVQLEDVLGMRVQMNLPATTDERANWRQRLPVALETLMKDKISLLETPKDQEPSPYPSPAVREREAAALRQRSDAAGEGQLSFVADALNKERGKAIFIPPRATYRLQLHKEFTLDDAASIVPYLAALGISHVYCSSYLKAQPGSTHGYDVVDYQTINPELGGEAAFARFTAALEQHGLQHILDFVPNHMGIGPENAWWMSVLKEGEASPYAKCFDIDWSIGKVLLPVLGKPLEEVIAAGELVIKDREIWYFDQHFPLAESNASGEDFSQSSWALKESSPYPSPAMREREAAASRQRNHKAAGEGHTILPPLPTDIFTLLERQHYRLAYWREASTHLNYRRFFDISTLAGVRMERPDVFADAHRKVLALIEEGKLAGLRLDHIDGLADPTAYLRRLRVAIGADRYLVVEKILGAEEALPEDWPVEGTSGYDALNQILGLFVDPNAEKPMTALYHEMTGDTRPFAEMVRDAKRLILSTSMQSELSGVVVALQRLLEDSPVDASTEAELRRTLSEIIAAFPVYRSYVTPKQVSAADLRAIEEACQQAVEQGAEAETVATIRRLLTREWVPGGSDAFIRKFQQLSGPAMAKGLEDTSFYRNARLLALNEVGGDPRRFGLTLEAFHSLMKARARDWPHAMLATATHDTKRGEEARLRIALLSHFTEAWAALLPSVKERSDACRYDLQGVPVPSDRECYFLWQTLLGSWPETIDAPYLERLDAYVLKALREAKEHTSWTEPNEAYEQAVQAYLKRLLADAAFLDLFQPFAEQIAQAAEEASLVQTALKLTLPGVPDIYQGCEFVDLSLVDPDNRRPVDYEARREALQETTNVSTLLAKEQFDHAKQRLIHCLLAHRHHYPELYAFGSYAPLEASGAEGRTLAFRRVWNMQELLVIARLEFSGKSSFSPGDIAMEGSFVSLLEDGAMRLATTLDMPDDMPIMVLFREKSDAD